jgi:Uma2 family endonuclease
MATVRAMEQATALEPHRWTRDEYDRMVEVGLLGPDAPVELLDGVIIEMTREGADHGDVVQELIGLFAPAAALRRLRVGQPLSASGDSEPEPDLALTRPPEAAGHPTTASLAVEVVASQALAARVKIAIYAAAGVDEYWIVDLPRRAVVVFTMPGGEGYAERRTLRGEDVLTVPEFGIETTVAGIFARAGLA